MSYAVVQTDLISPSVEQLIEAFRAVESLVDLDARRTARRQFGVLAEGINRADADRLAEALVALGVPAAAIPESDLAGLPAPVNARRVDCLEQSLVLYDALDRALRSDWERVTLIAVGEVGHIDTVNEMVTRQVPAGRAHVTIIDRQRSERMGSEVVMEVWLDQPERRFVTREQTLLYHYLGSRRQLSRRANFLLVLRDLIAHSPRALVNRGAASLPPRGGRILGYPDRRSFEREIQWLLWWSRSSATGGS